jgi:hypothetical protein
MNDAAGWYKMATMMRTTDGLVIRGGYGGEPPACRRGDSSVAGLEFERASAVGMLRICMVAAAAACQEARAHKAPWFCCRRIYRT